MKIMKKRQHPRFNVPNYGRKERKRIKLRWRKPRGQDNKKRRGYKNMGASPSIGYKNPSSVRGLHPCGKREALVFNPAELDTLQNVAVRIGAGVGKRKREQIRQKAKEKGLEVLN